MRYNALALKFGKEIDLLENICMSPFLFIQKVVNPLLIEPLKSILFLKSFSNCINFVASKEVFVIIFYRVYKFNFIRVKPIILFDHQYLISGVRKLLDGVFVQIIELLEPLEH